MVDKQKVVAGRSVVDAYRVAHHQLHSKAWHRRVPEEHTPLLRAMVKGLMGLGYTSKKEELRDRAPEVLAKFWVDSDLENFKELGYESRDDFKARATEANKATLREMWT